MIGVNVYGLFGSLAADRDGTLKAVHDAGIEGVELFVVPIRTWKGIPQAVCTMGTYPDFIHAVHGYGMAVPSAHIFCAVGSVLFPKRWIIRCLRDLHNNYGVDSFVFSGMFSDARGAKRWAKYLKQIAAVVVPEGCKILYHNHSQEFTLLDASGTTAMDVFLAEAGTQVLMQLDIGWAGIAGDEAAIAQKYADRIQSLHLKDFTPGSRGKYQAGQMPKERFCAVGEGEIRTAELLKMRGSFPRFGGNIIIDQDSSSNILADVATGCRNVKKILGCI